MIAHGASRGRRSGATISPYGYGAVDFAMPYPGLAPWAIVLRPYGAGLVAGAVVGEVVGGGPACPGSYQSPRSQSASMAMDFSSRIFLAPKAGISFFLP